MSNKVTLGLPQAEILYDKIINIELVSMERNVDVAHVISGDVVKNIDEIGNIAIPNDIVIYKGFEHKEYWTDINGISYSKTVKATGLTINVDADRQAIGEVRKEGIFKKAEGSNTWWVDKNLQEEISSQLKTLSLGKNTKLVGGVNGSKVNLGVQVTLPSRINKIKGSALNTTPIQDGVRIIVNNDGKQEKYHAVYVRQDDAQSTYMHVVDTIKINCDSGGIKPSISFSTNVIPGNNCYKMTLKLFNMNLNYDIRKIKSIKVTAGYRTQGYQTVFTCPVFSSYIESPNPDGVTVFECLCVGRCESFINNDPVNFHYLGGKITIEEFIAETARGLGENIVIHNYLKKEYKNLEMHITSRMDTYFENGAATLSWMRNMIQKRIAAADGFPTNKPEVGSDVSYPYIMCALGQEGDLYVYALNRENSDTKGKKEEDLFKDTTSIRAVPALDTIKGASFNGVALSVKALWNPRIKPGELFKMYANVYNGANLPNTVAKSQYGNGNDKKDSRQHFYRCITCSISFSTNGKENEMSILAVPLIYMEDNAYKNLDFVDSFDKFVTTALSTYDTRGGKDIFYGKNNKQVTEATPEQQIISDSDSSRNKMYSQNLYGTFSSVTFQEIKPGDSLSKIAATVYEKGKGYCDFDIIPENPKDLPQGVYTGTPLMENTRACLWPLIAVLTYNYWQMQKNGHNPYENMSNMKNPDMIHVGKQLVIPVIPSFEVLKSCKEVFKYAYYAWPSDSAFPQYAGWNGVWYKLYQYLGGTF